MNLQINFTEFYKMAVSSCTMAHLTPDPLLLVPNTYHYASLSTDTALADTGRRSTIGTDTTTAEAARAQAQFLHILAGGSHLCETLFYFRFTPLDCAILLYTERGNGVLSYANTTRTLSAGTLLLLDCRQNFSLKSSQLPWSFSIFFLNGGSLPFFLEKMSGISAPCYTLSKHTPIRQQLSELLRLPTDVSLSVLVKMQLLLNEILSTLYLSNYPIAETEPVNVPSYLVSLKDRFDHHWEEPFSLDACSDYFAISKYRICREFARFYGEPPLKYLNHTRIKQAKKMLLTTELNVHEISSTIGYENVNHFIHLFKKENGLTPGAFRQTALAGQCAVHSPVQ